MSKFKHGDVVVDIHKGSVFILVVDKPASAQDLFAGVVIHVENPKQTWDVKHSDSWKDEDFKLTGSITN